MDPLSHRLDPVIQPDSRGAFVRFPRRVLALVLHTNRRGETHLGKRAARADLRRRRALLRFPEQTPHPPRGVVSQGEAVRVRVRILQIAGEAGAVVHRGLRRRRRRRRQAITGGEGGGGVLQQWGFLRRGVSQREEQWERGVQLLCEWEIRRGLDRWEVRWVWN